MIVRNVGREELGQAQLSLGVGVRLTRSAEMARRWPSPASWRISWSIAG
jgi:hypothetical protein